ncbi:MAG: hypothetical protein ABIQ11_11250, partial [Saprospiraceae bacterium]
MKTTITTLLLLFSLHLGISQDVRYEIRGKYTRGVSKEKLSTAKTMIDIRPGYPSGMIEKYTSTEISVSVDGNVMQATGANETLSASQQSLLQVAEVGSDISVEIGYIHQNPVTLFPDIRQMHFVLTVVPEVEAVYPGGYNELISYIEKNAIEKISEKFAKDQNMALISFTVDEEGEISNARITQPSNDP